MKAMIEKIKKFFKRLFKKQKQESTTQQIDTNAEQAAFKYVSFGSPNCAKAIEDPMVQIKDLKWSSSSLSYKWKSSTKLEQWGIADPHAAEALACFGYLDQTGTWRFGKIDWISSDRLSRSMANVYGRYNGINPDVYFAASKHGFFIMEKNGKRRSNIIIA